MKLSTYVLAAAVLFTALSTPSQQARAQSLRPRTLPAGQVYGDLTITRNGRDIKLAPGVWKFWQLDGGRTLLWAGSDGAGGFENEGQSLWRYDAATGRKSKLGAFHYMIHGIRDVHSPSGRRGFVLTMFDGGLGAPHIAVVREHGGIAWQQRIARVAAIRNGRIVLALMNADDIHGHEDTSNIRPRRLVYRSLDALLK